jgi:hypothetical protein
MPDQISRSEHYNRVCSQIDLYSKRMIDSFNLFIQLSIATIGGFIWLKIQPNASNADTVFPLLRWILPLLAAFTIFELFSDLVSWYGLRKAEAKLLNRPDLRPKPLRSGRQEYFRASIAILVGIAGFIFLR